MAWTRSLNHIVVSSCGGVSGGGGLGGVGQFVRGDGLGGLGPVGLVGGLGVSSSATALLGLPLVVRTSSGTSSSSAKVYSPFGGGGASHAHAQQACRLCGESYVHRRGFAADAADGGETTDGTEGPKKEPKIVGPRKASVRRAAEKRLQLGADGAVRVGYGEGARASMLGRAAGQVFGAYVYATMNNTHVTVTSQDGSHKYCNGSAGKSGFKGARRGTSYAAQVVGEDVAKKATKLGIEKVIVSLRGVGFGKESATRGLIKGGLSVVGIRERTRRPFNGCRPPRKRRV